MYVNMHKYLRFPILHVSPVPEIHGAAEKPALLILPSEKYNASKNPKLSGSTMENNMP
jgi:hypothetical protein